MILPALVVSAILAHPRTAADAKDALQGAWQATSLEADGRPAPAQAVDRMRYTFKGDKLLIRGNFRDDREDEVAYEIDATKSPKHFQFTPPKAPKPVMGIYEVKGDELKICVKRGGGPDERPSEFSSKSGSQQVLIVFKKAAK